VLTGYEGFEQTGKRKKQKEERERTREK